MRSGPPASSAAGRPTPNLALARDQRLDLAEMLGVVVDRDREQAADVEPAVRRVDAEATPAGRIEATHELEGPHPPSAQLGDGPLDGVVPWPRPRPGLEPDPRRRRELAALGTGGRLELLEPGLPHERLRGDEVADDLERGPLAPRRYARAARRRRHASRARGEAINQRRLPAGFVAVAHGASMSRRHDSVASTWLNVYTWRSMTFATGSASTGATPRRKAVGR